MLRVVRGGTCHGHFVKATSVPYLTLPRHRQEQSRAEQSRAEQSRAEQSRAKQSTAQHSKQISRQPPPTVYARLRRRLSEKPFINHPLSRTPSSLLAPTPPAQSRLCTQVPNPFVHSRVAMSASSPAYPPYQPHRNSQSFDPNTPPAPPPKPSSQEVSRRSTPAGSQSLIPPPPAQQQDSFRTHEGGSEDPQFTQQARMREAAYAQHTQDPGEQWLPKILEDKSYVMLLLGLP
jgi:hypothetical protein